jgi:alpha-ketoglutarate-dependent taurine dioxygenase
MNLPGSSSLDQLSQIFDITELPARFLPSAPVPVVLTVRQQPRGALLDTATAQAIRAELDARAALLIRGLTVADPCAVSAVSDAVFAGEQAFASGEHPQVQGAEAVYQPVRYAPAETLLWHHEDSFNAKWPRFVMFTCAIPAHDGGQTTIADSRLVYTQMPQAIKETLARHGIRYERLCDGRTSRSWEQIYGTSRHDLAHRRATANGEDLLLTSHGARIRALRPAFQQTPHGTSWFNQLLHWHPHALPAELRRMTADGLLPAYRTCHVGDGTEIPADPVDLLIEAHRSVEFAIQWRPGDVLLIDNAVVAHGRRPYCGRREHFVRMFAPHSAGAIAKEAP